MGLSPGDGPFQPAPPDGFGDGLAYAILAALNWLLNALLAVIVWIWNLLVTVVNAIVSVFKTVLKFLAHIWQNYIKPAISWLVKEYQKVRAWLKRILGPVLKRLQAIKKWYDEHILKQQLRLLLLIQQIRRILGILRLFHVKWAGWLDNALADIQNKVQQSIAITRGILNQIINTLAMVLDPTLLITRNVLGGSLLGNLGAIKRIFGYGDNRIISASEQATLDKDHALYHKDTVETHARTLVQSGPTDDDKARREAARKALADVTNTSLPF